jgi:hypothetical protein
MLGNLVKAQNSAKRFGELTTKALVKEKIETTLTV